MHLNENDHKHDGFYQHVHVDEKWFFLTEQQMRMYLAPGEEAPLRVCQKKDHIVKVMFLAAVARPRYDENGLCAFDGKIGMWPFVERVAAQRRSGSRCGRLLHARRALQRPGRQGRMAQRRADPRVHDQRSRQGDLAHRHPCALQPGVNARVRNPA